MASPNKFLHAPAIKCIGGIAGSDEALALLDLIKNGKLLEKINTIIESGTCKGKSFIELFWVVSNIAAGPYE